jgi:hypothetical protein
MVKSINRRLRDIDQRKWREGKVRPSQGNPPHDRLVSRGYWLVKENLRRSLPRHFIPTTSKDDTVACGRRFLRHGGIFRSDVVKVKTKVKVKVKTKPWGGAVPPPDGRPLAQVQERAGRITPSSSFSMSSDRLILDRVGRHQSPSPLHRHTQINMHFSAVGGKGDISILLGRGHFYFALTRRWPALISKCPPAYTSPIRWQRP